MAESVITNGQLPNQNVGVFKGVVNNSNISGLKVSNPIVQKTSYFTSANASQGFGFITGTNLSLSGIIKLVDNDIANKVNNQLNNDRGSHYNYPLANILYSEDGGVTSSVCYFNLDGTLILSSSNQVINQSIISPSTGLYGDDLSLGKITYTYSLGKNSYNKDLG